ncbi:MAG: hypothetical protein C5B56_06515 [Proteobacteria bacterium]|nr:MAG: hypothetical protein C5B56_06515 [Pseudomonadota bacterium]
MPAKSSAQGTAHKHDELLRQVADSEPFRTAPTMRALLLYLWEHQGEPISEYAIATEALGRSSDFDPKLDSTVRVQVARLRTKLKDFYQANNGTFPLRLSVPLGRHELHWTYEPLQKSLAARLRVVPKNYWWAIGLSELALVAVCVVLAFQNHGLRAALPSPRTPTPRFWRSFLMDGKPTVIVVPSPMYFFWPSHQVYIRDLQISDFPNWPASPMLKEMAGRWGPPELSQQYVGAMEMNAGIRLLQYLENEGHPVRLTESRRFPAESFAAQNTIFLGMPRTAAYLSQMLEKTNFYIEHVSPDVIRNRHPLPGEPAEFQEVSYSADRRVAPAIIVLLPPRPERTRMLLLLGRNQTSLSSMLVSLEGLKLLDDQWARSGSPDAWEIVIQAEIYRDTILKMTPVACRPIAASFWN